jgi:hypothetical protein
MILQFVTRGGCNSSEGEQEHGMKHLGLGDLSVTKQKKTHIIHATINITHFTL